MYNLYSLITIISAVSSFTPQSPSTHQRHNNRGLSSIQIVPNSKIIQQPFFSIRQTENNGPSLSSSSSFPSYSFRRRDTSLFAADLEEDNTTDISTAATKSSTATSSLSNDKNEEDDDEWEFEEYENLSETDFYDSEWKVGTVMENKNKIVETWTRLVVKDGEFICVWGDGSSGKWNFDRASQFLSMSKDSFGGWFGKRIWAGTVDDYYYVQGSIRGWSPISPASVIGQWQAKRLSVDRDEAGDAPWFEDDDDEDETKNDDNDVDEKSLEKSNV